MLMQIKCSFTVDDVEFQKEIEVNHSNIDFKEVEKFIVGFKQTLLDQLGIIYEYDEWEHGARHA